MYIYLRETAVFVCACPNYAFGEHDHPGANPMKELQPMDLVISETETFLNIIIISWRFAQPYAQQLATISALLPTNGAVHVTFAHAY